MKIRESGRGPAAELCERLAAMAKGSSTKERTAAVPLLVGHGGPRRDGIRVLAAKFEAQSCGQRLRPGSLAWRRRVWTDHKRNKLFGKIALATEDAHRGDPEALKNLLGLRRTKRAREIVQEITKRSENPCIWVESPEHGRVLAKMLPNWRLMTDEPDAEDVRERSMVCAFFIVTTCALVTLLGKPDLIIRATGCVDLIDTRWLGEDGWMIDLMETGDPILQRDSDARFAAYRVNNWLY